MSRLVPKLRFKEFSGEWEEKPILDIASMKARIGWQNLRQDEHLDNGEYYLITGTDFRDGIIDWDNAKYVEFERYIQDKHIILKEGDILITKDGSIGKLAYVENIKEKKATLNNGIFRIRIKDNNTKFIYYTFLSLQFKNFLEKLSAGSSINHLYQKDFKTYKIILPQSQKEQQKIANTLSSLDNLIEAQQRKVEALQKHKKGLMQQLFPSEGANEPKLRFKEFSGEWEEKKLGEIALLTSSKRIYLSDYVDDGIPFYRGKEISQLQNNDNIDDLLYISEAKYLEIRERYGVPTKNDILITSVGTIGNILRIKDSKKFYFKDGNLIWLKNIIIDSNFLEYLLKKENNKILMSSIGSSQKALTMVGLNKITIHIPPTPKEQQKIANTLSSLDNLIEAQQRKVEALKKYKKGLMQQMFVSGED